MGYSSPRIERGWLLRPSLACGILSKLDLCLGQALQFTSNATGMHGGKIGRLFSDCEQASIGNCRVSALASSPVMLPRCDRSTAFRCLTSWLSRSRYALGEQLLRGLGTR